MPEQPPPDRGLASLYDALNRIGVYAGLAWSLALAVLLVVRLARSSPALRRLLWPVLLPAAAYLALVAWTFADSLDRGALGNGPIARDLWLAQAAALIALAAGVVWGWVRARHRRTAVARLVVEVAASPEPGGLREKLAQMLHDESVELAYPLADGRLVDALGRPLALDGQVTPLVRDGETDRAAVAPPGPARRSRRWPRRWRQQPAWRSRTSGCRRRCGRSSSICDARGRV